MGWIELNVYWAQRCVALPGRGEELAAAAASAAAAAAASASAFAAATMLLVLPAGCGSLWLAIMSPSEGATA